MKIHNQIIKTRTLEEYDLVMRIRSERKRHGIVKISRLTGIPTNTIRDWIYRGVKPKRLRKTKILPEKSKKLTPELAYILGVIEGDGCLCKSRRKSIPGENYDYFLVLQVTDEDFSHYFSKQVEKWSSFKTYKNKHPQSGKGFKDIYVERLRSKDVYEFLSNFDLNILLRSDEKIKSMFLKGFYDSEGCVKIKKTRGVITVGVVNLEIITFVRLLLESLKIKIPNLRIRNIEGYKTFYLFDICSIKSLELYRDKIGFSIKRKQNRLINLLDQFPSSVEIENKRKAMLQNRKTLYNIIQKNPGLCLNDFSKKN